MGHGTINTSKTGTVLNASINNPPINLCDWQFMSDLNDLLTEVVSSGDIKILVVQSANPDFFVAHLDLLPHPESTLPEMHPEYPTLGYFFGLMYKLTNLPIVTIALVEGCARAGGCDFTMAFDMRFGIKGRTRLAHVEACLGVYASGGGAMRLVQQMGKPRALEYLYSGRDIGAEEGESASSLETFEKDFQAFVELLTQPKTVQLVTEIWAVIKGATDCEEERTLPDALMAMPSYR
ncbi:enoyl-CoA hydratase [Penicillium sp. IBT 16267x]|nr:enoyl-CoA hydratase [Penicillium sp. IBT 16267x]